MLSGVTEELVFDQLPVGAWLTDLGTHRLRDVARPERVTQLCHPDLRNEFPPLRMSKTAVPHRLPAQFTSFVGRGTQMEEVRKLLAEHRLVTLTGAGGAGKTRFAIEIASQMADEFGDGVWYADLAPISQPDLVTVTWRERWVCPTNRAARPRTRWCGSSATARCWWFWTTASIFLTNVLRWRRRCWAPARR